MNRATTIFVATLLACLFPLQAVASTAESRPKPRKIEGRTDLEVGLRGGWFFQLNQPVADDITERAESLSATSLGVDLEFGPTIGHNLSVLLRFGYQSRLEIWESPNASAVDDLKLVYSLVHLPAVNIKYRPVYERVSPYITAGAGLDLLLYSPSIGVVYMPQVIRLPGAGFNAGVGVEFYISWRFAFVVDLRYNVTLHGTDRLMFVAPDGSDAFYNLDFGPAHHNLNLYAGLQLKL